LYIDCDIISRNYVRIEAKLITRYSKNYVSLNRKERSKQKEDQSIVVQQSSQDSKCSHITRIEHRAGFEQMTQVSMGSKPYE
jgi:hypothetical protein